MPATGAAGLLTLHWQRLGRGARAIDLCVLGFTGAGFSVATFAGHAMACPDAIAASVPKRQAEFFFGRLAARCALHRLDPARGPATIAIGAGREPLWPPDIIGSISHNDRFAAAVTLRQRDAGGVGIDVESVLTAESQHAVLAMAVSAAEYAYLRQLGSALPLATLLTLVFSAKESLYKSAYPTVGRFFDFTAARVSHVDVQAQTLTLTLLEALSTVFCQDSVWTVDFAFLQADTVVTSLVWAWC